MTVYLDGKTDHKEDQDHTVNGMKKGKNASKRKPLESHQITVRRGAGRHPIQSQNCGHRVHHEQPCW